MTSLKERYILIDSTYRNRYEWKNPAEFELTSTSAFNKDSRYVNFIDPISDEAVLLTFTPFVSKAGNIDVLNSIPASFSNISTNFIAIFPVVNNMSRVENYYTGSSIINSFTNNTAIILNWEYVLTFGGNDYFRIITSGPIFTSVANPIITIYDSTSVTSPLGENYLYFIPTGIIADNWYTDTYYIWNDDKKEGAVITHYDSVHRLATISSVGLSSAWALTDQVVLRKKLPVILDTFGVGSTQRELVLSVSASSVTGFYKNQYIRIPDEVVSVLPDPKVNQTRRIVEYSGSTSKIATVESPFVNAPMSGTGYEIFSATKDNFSSFNYVGSNVSNQEMVCYEIKLVNLTLPNQPLSEGSRIAFYPYVLVEFQNVSSAGAGLHNIIYSNNPNTNRKLFRAAIDDVNNPVTSPFIKVDGDSMTQTVKFKPNDNLKFAIYLPNGKLFDTILNDNLSPNEPNPLIQISALFSIKRL